MSEQIKDIYPKGKCPKCGIGIFGRPQYHTTWGGDSEWIIWECNTCGYTIRTPTADAKVK